MINNLYDEVLIYQDAYVRETKLDDSLNPFLPSTFLTNLSCMLVNSYSLPEGFFFLMILRVTSNP